MEIDENDWPKEIKDANEKMGQVVLRDLARKTSEDIRAVACRAPALVPNAAERCELHINAAYKILIYALADARQAFGLPLIACVALLMIRIGDQLQRFVKMRGTQEAFDKVGKRD